MLEGTTPEAPDQSSEELRLHRLVLLAGAAINLVFWSVRRLAGLPGSDPLWQRLVLSGVCTAVGLATLGPPRIRARVPIGMEVIAFVGTLWWIHRVGVNSLRPEYAIGLFVPPAIISLAFRRPSHHLAYALFTVMAAAVVFSRLAAPAVPPGFTVACLAAMLGLMHVQIRTRLRVADALGMGEALRGAISQQTTDAIVLVDPVRREAIEWNARARELFAVPSGGSVAVLAASALGFDRLDAAQMSAVTGALVHAGTYRGRSRCRTADGVEFPAELGIRVVRLGRRDLWFVRVTPAPAAGTGTAGDRGSVEPPVRPPDGEFRPEELRMYRLVLVAGAGVMTGLWYLRRALGLVSADPLWQRLILSAACLVVAGATAGPPWMRRRVGAGIQAIAYLGSLWWVYRVAATGLRPDYAVGLMVVPATIGLGFYRPRRHLMYGVAVLAAAAALYLPLPAPGTSPLFVLLCLAMVLGLTHLLLRARLMAYDALLAADDLRHVLFEFTTDALVLADPIARKTLDSNGRARALFCTPGAGAPDVSLATALALPNLGTTDIVYVMKDIADHGVYRRVRQYVRPGLPGFTGDLAITAMRYRHRQVWLVRVADRTGDPAVAVSPG